MANLGDLQKRMYARAEEVAQVGNEAKKHIATAAIRYLINITPVDTSQALSNWQIGNGHAVPTHISAYFEGDRGSTQSASSNKAFEEALQLIALAKPGVPIYLSNVLQYIRRLDQGSSQQHPGGFVRASVIVGKSSLRNFKYKWK